MSVEDENSLLQSGPPEKTDRVIFETGGSTGSSGPPDTWPTRFFHLYYLIAFGLYFIVLWGRPLPRFSSESSLEEIASRFLVLYLAVLSFLHLRYMDRHHLQRRMVQVVLILSVVLVLLENNWDLTLRESEIGRIVVAILFSGCLAYLFFETGVKDRTNGLLLVGTMGALAISQALDALHDGKYQDNQLLELFSGLDSVIGLEEWLEMLAFFMLVQVFMRWLEQQEPPSVALRIWYTPTGHRLLLGLLLLSVGNGLLVRTASDPDHPYSVILGVILDVAGVILLYQGLESVERIDLMKDDQY